MAARFGAHEPAALLPEGVNRVADRPCQQQGYHHDQHDIACGEAGVFGEAGAVEEVVVLAAGEAEDRGGAGQAAGDQRAAGLAVPAGDGVGGGGAGEAEEGVRAGGAVERAQLADSVVAVVGARAARALVGAVADRAGTAAASARALIVVVANCTSSAGIG